MVSTDITYAGSWYWGGCTQSNLVLFKSTPISSHLSKRPSDLKLNGTQEKTLFYGTVFYTLSHGLVRFVASGSSNNETGFPPL